MRRRRINPFKISAIIFLFLFCGTLTFLLMKDGEESSAVSTVGFTPGNIISDYIMSNHTSMTEQEIQNFLKSKNSCNKSLPTSGYTNEGNGFYSNTFGTSKKYMYHIKNGKFVCLADEIFGSGNEFGETIKNGETAAHIIWQTAQDFKINPQVLLVLLEKEQGLISDDWPNNYQYRAATGYGCPDTAACDAKYYGFKNQVRKAAELFRTVLDGGWTNYPLGNNYIQYNPDKSCGGSTVNIENLATSALYRYTPYQPNQAALNAGYGTAPCGAYGNRNFYLYFSDWFGDPKNNQTTVKEQPAEQEKQEPLGVKITSEQVLDDGIYQISSAGNDSLVMDITGGVTSYIKSGEMEIWSKKQTKTENIENQIFELKYDNSEHVYYITNPISDLYLDVFNGENVDGTKIIAWKQNGGCNQKWAINKNSGGNGYKITSICSGKVIGVKNIANGNGLVLSTKKESVSQNWNFNPINLNNHENIEGTYNIVSRISDDLVLDVEGGIEIFNQSTKKAIIYGKKTTNNDNQLFTIKKDDASDYYFIYNQPSGLYLDVYNNNKTDGTKIIFWPYNGGCNQKWKITQSNGKFYTISSSCTDKALDVFEAKNNPTTPTILYRKNGGINQEWSLEK